MRRLPAIGLLLVVAVAIAARRPDVFTEPQFWAEDGMEWYARAYNEPGLLHLVAPYGGYMQLFPRLAGLLAQAVPFAVAPLLMAVLSIGVQSIAPVVLLSDPFAWAVPRRAVRFVLALLVVAAPNLMEVHANATNGQVHLAFLAFLILLAEPREGRGWRTFDAGFLLLSGFSGPFCLLLLPVAVLAWWHWRDRWSLVRLGCVLVPTLVQGVLLSPLGSPLSVPVSHGLVARTPRSPFGATPGNLLRIYGGQIVVGTLGGWQVYVGLHAGAFATHPWLPAILGLAGIAFVARAAWTADSTALRLLLLYATLHVAAGLASPIIFGPRLLWEMLAEPGAGQRDWYTMIVAFLATLVWTAAADPRRGMRVLGAALLAVSVASAIRGDWRLPPREDFGFVAQAERLASSPPGKIVRIAIPPAPNEMRLIRGCEEPRVQVVSPERARRLRSRRACPDR